MSNNPVISICIPVYNGREYLKECLDSALSQSFKDIEIVIVDDCSVDNSVEIIKTYLLKDTRVKLFVNEKNFGLVGNWNECIRHASGEWIKFLFQDDYLANNCLDIMLHSSKNECSLIVCKRTYLVDYDAPDSTKRYYDSGVATLDKYGFDDGVTYITPKKISNLTCENVTMNFIGEPTSIMFRRALTEEVGLFNQELKQICDLEFALRIASKYGVVYMPERLTSFRVHKNSTTNRNITENYYSLANLEPVKFVHLLLFDDVYKQFRKYISSFNSMKLKLYFRLRVYEAFRNQKEIAVNKEDYDSAIKKFPMLKLLGHQSLIIKVLYRLLLLRRKIKS